MATVFTSAADLVGAVDLEDIYCEEERGRRIRWSEDDLAGRTFPESSNTMGILRDGRAILFRFRTLFTDQGAEYVADWTTQFTLPDEDDEVEQSVLEEFAEKVAFFAAYPYVRASIYGSASRLNQPVPVLGLVRQGQFEKGDRLDDAAATAEFYDVESERVHEA